MKDEKVLIFTQYADTAIYLYDNLKNDDVKCITSKEKNNFFPEKKLERHLRL